MQLKGSRVRAVSQLTDDEQFVPILFLDLPAADRLLRAANLDHFTATLAPPQTLHDPVSLTRRLSPALVRKQQDSVRVSLLL